MTYEASKTIGGIPYNDVFILKPGETVVINFPTFGEDNEEIELYSIVECGVNTVAYSSVKVNGTTLNGTESSENRKDFDIGFDSTGNRPRVNYENIANPQAMRTLTFTKKLYDADGSTPISDDSTTFDFRLYFGTESDTEMTGANMYTYHVKDKYGSYCRWDAASQSFVKIGEGITDYTQLTADQKIAASFSTSMNGAISKIPVDYTVEVRQILAGTQYMVQERPSEIPDGYSFQKYVFYEDYTNNSGTITESYSGGKTVAAAGAPDSNYNIITVGKDPHVDICNLKGWGLRMNKVWTDADYMSKRDATYFAVYTQKNENENGQGYGLEEYVRGSLKKLPYGETSLYWYWLILPESDIPFERYVVREVTIENGEPEFNGDGEVTNEDDLIHHIRWIREGETLTLSGTQKGETGTASFPYTVRYEKGEISEGSNVRVDTVTNDRPGIILKKQDWSEAALEGATFTLTEEGSSTLIGTFNSDEEGYITTAFLGEGKNYTLTETNTPQNYHGMEADMTICASAGIITVSGVGEDWYSLIQASGTTPATLIIKNRPYIFQAVKKDRDTDTPLEGVTFALHRQVTVGDVTTIDTNPMPGYEELITDENGLVPLLNETLPAGTYELREKSTLTGYEPLSGYIRFTVSATGTIILIGTDQQPIPDGVTLEDEVKDEGTLQYVLTIPNSQRKNVSFKKVSSKDETSALAGAVFDLYNVTIENGVEIRQIPALYTGLTSDSDGLLADSSGNNVFDLPVGKYHLVETTAPGGYNIRTTPVVITVTASGVTYDSDIPASYDSVAKIYTMKISNTPGIELPKTGGVGTAVWTAVGAALSGAAGVVLMLRRKKRRI